MRWNRHTPRDEVAHRYAEQFSISPLTAQILLNRGVTSPEAMRRFLHPTLNQLNDSWLLRDMRPAVERIERALRAGERVHVHGDYDVDGLSATALLYLALSGLGADVHAITVQRHDAAIGLSVESLRRDHLPQRPGLIITADCGSTNLEAIGEAAGAGIDVIVVDHHQLGDRRPDCVALLNPHQEGCAFPFKSLAAVGVAYHLVHALQDHLRQQPDAWPVLPLAQYVDIVALGTVADVVPLVDDNRIFVQEGLKTIRSARRPGICALMRSARLLGDSRQSDWSDRINARTIGYRLAPLINAAGRMGDASRCVELLATDSYRVAVQIADDLVRINQERQACEREILREAMAMADLQVEAGNQVVVVAREAWHPGVLGIVASRLVERTNRPAIVAAIDCNGIARGSIRSPHGINMLDALDACRDLLETWGGHPVAAGLQLRSDRLEAFTVAVNDAVRRSLPDGTCPERCIDVDATVAFDDLNDDLLRQFECLAPFGVGNPEPVLEAVNVTPIQTRVQGSTLRVRLRQGHLVASAVGYGMSTRAVDFGRPVDVLFSPRTSPDPERRRMDIYLRDARVRGAT